MPTFPAVISIMFPCCSTGTPRKPSNSTVRVEFRYVKACTTNCSAGQGQGTATRKKAMGMRRLRDVKLEIGNRKSEIRRTSSVIETTSRAHSQLVRRQTGLPRAASALERRRGDKGQEEGTAESGEG